MRFTWPLLPRTREPPLLTFLRLFALLSLWKVLQERNSDLPKLLLVGKLDRVGHEISNQLQNVEIKPVEQIDELQETVGRASVLLLPSEIEGFGLPALEAYYVGTPVCYASGTSVAEVVDPLGHQGSFQIVHSIGH
jgi:glycosyltransferase involved in cell wall biosynthesis